MDNVVTTAKVLWPDSRKGTFTTVYKHPTWKTVDAFSITYVIRTSTDDTLKYIINQDTLTRDASGNVTLKSQLFYTFYPDTPKAKWYYYFKQLDPIYPEQQWDDWEE
ncbi:MAG: hypothetical protein JW860_12240 [Sedimentisphaerales bacterium]|nr:hypothetical protein [Sedimentisphaerales bacterium]